MRTVFCGSCARTVVWADPSRAACVYGGAVATAITAFKYRSRPDLARPLGELLVRVALPLAGAVDVVAPVPLHPTRLAERGYNQAALLARPVARALDVPFLPRLLERCRVTPKQAELDRAARDKNVTGAFRAQTLAGGARVLVVDDVRTTGATLSACEEALRHAGAALVKTLALAETPPI
jgi:ComF family protein